MRHFPRHRVQGISSHPLGGHNFVSTSMSAQSRRFRSLDQQEMAPALVSGSIVRPTKKGPTWCGRALAFQKSR